MLGGGLLFNFGPAGSPVATGAIGEDTTAYDPNIGDRVGKWLLFGGHP